MENTNEEREVASSSAMVYMLPGEPAVVINGMPEIPSTDDSLDFPNAVNNAESHRNTNFAVWLEGREVRKLFGDQCYSGVVTECDKEVGWYRVVYEDGDFEDMDWSELEQVILPLDIMVPMKALALKALKKRKNPVKKYEKIMDQSPTPKVKAKRGRPRKTSVPEDAPLKNSKVPECAPLTKSEVPEDASMMNSKAPEDAAVMNSTLPEDAPMMNFIVPEDPLMNSHGLQWT